VVRDAGAAVAERDWRPFTGTLVPDGDAVVGRQIPHASCSQHAGHDRLQVRLDGGDLLRRDLQVVVVFQQAG